MKETQCIQEIRIGSISLFCVLNLHHGGLHNFLVSDNDIDRIRTIQAPHKINPLSIGKNYVCTICEKDILWDVDKWVHVAAPEPPTSPK